MKAKGLALRKIPEKYRELPLVPSWVLMPLWAVSLFLPNLIYSGVRFADTLHILKWAVTGIPAGIALIAASLRVIRYGRERVNVKMDMFGAVWLLILVYCSLMPLWVKIVSPTAYVLEMVCFAVVWVFYVLSASSFPEWGLRPVLILANINAAINVMFAELQIRDMNNLAFLDGTAFSGLRQYSSIILPTPGNYIGNTAQQNMFGLWTAIAVLGAVYLYVYDVWKSEPSAKGRKIIFPVIGVALAVISLKYAVIHESIILGIVSLILILLSFVSVYIYGNEGRTYYGVFVLILISINFWGLMNSTSRSATIALMLGLLTMLIISMLKYDRNYVYRFAAVAVLLASVFWVSLSSPRSGQIVDKTVDIVKNAENIGNRRGIWMTSYAMFLEYPYGVGIGQYKWHYLDGQRYGFQMVHDDWYRWQYTHWAHNEFLQFFCEGGWIGGILLLVMWGVWLFPALIGVLRRGSEPPNITSAWGISLAVLVTFCAVFTRPFHRIENMVWITLAFALSNRVYLPSKMKFEVLKSGTMRKIVGAVMIASSVAGFAYIWSGIYGNWVLRKALSTQDEKLQMYYLTEAEKHPIVREEAQRNIGYHYIQVGEQANDNEALVKGFNTLWEHFQREPHSEDISRLLNFAQRYQIEPVIREIASYFRPGDYHLQRVPQKDSSGRVVNALLMVNGPGSDDD